MMYGMEEKNTEYEKENLQATVKTQWRMVIVWNCMSANGVGSNYFIDNIM